MSADPTAPSGDQAPVEGVEQPQSHESAPAAAPAEQPPQATGTEPAEPQQSDAAVPEGLAPFMDRITPLLEPDENGHTMLAGLLEFYELTGDESRADEFEQWWEQVGQSYGFLDENGDPVGDDGEAGGEGEREGDDRVAQLEQQLQQLTQRLEQQDTQTRQSAAAQQVTEDLNKLMAEHGIADDPSLPEEKQPRMRILKLAAHDGNIEAAVAEYLDLTGQAQQAMLNGAGQQTAPVGAAPGPSLHGGSPASEPEAVESWDDAKRAAVARMKAGGG